jgi:simple sugar transport system permease protein
MPVTNTGLGYDVSGDSTGSVAEPSDPGPVLFAQPVIVYFAFIIPILATSILYRTTWGLAICAVGDHPHAVATGTVCVCLSYIGVITSGVFAGLGGAALPWLTWVCLLRMTNGRGFASRSLRSWQVESDLVAAACILFGSADAAIASSNDRISCSIPDLCHVTLLAHDRSLAGFVGRTVGPKTVENHTIPKVFRS